MTGYVTRFAIDAGHIARFDVQQVGGANHLVHWNPLPTSFIG